MATDDDDDDVITAHLQNCGGDDKTAGTSVDGDDVLIADGIATDGIKVNVVKQDGCWTSEYSERNPYLASDSPVLTTLFIRI